ncbi:MAG: 5-formyltetrahydrofolate cyclo-ligase, partial [Nitrospirota bacterium]
ILARRDALSPEERHQRSFSIATALSGLPEYKSAGTVLFYVNFRSEVATRRMIEEALDRGKKVLVPKVDHHRRDLRLFELKDPSADLEAGYMNIYEPVEDRTREALPEEPDLVVMPGVGFDGDGNRLGYGGGYYDRLIVKLRPGVKLVALAFEEQMVDEVPTLPHDRKVDMIITETRIIEV